jgi:hypothetical protein
MYRSLSLTRLLPWTFLLAVVCGLPRPGEAQSVASGLDRPHLALGYVGNAPDAMVGGGGYYMTSLLGGLGLYLDAKFDIDNPSRDDSFESGLTAQQVLDQVAGANFVQSEKSFQSFNAAVVRPVSPYLAVYAGGGIVKVTQYHLFEQPTSGLGKAGVFWVEAPEFEETRANVMIGAFLRMSSFISTQIGIETEPRGFTIGASFRLPNR